MRLPKHKAGLYLTHNQHKDYYESVKDHIDEYPSIVADDFVSLKDMQKCIDTDELWELQWYPETPISFHKVNGSSLEIVLRRALEIEGARMKQECVVDGFSGSGVFIAVETTHDRVEFSSQHDFTPILTNPLKTDNGKTIGERNREWLHTKLDAWLDKTWEQE